ncbi:MAG: hypothetical protein H6R05_1418, partial [Burkholderiaceae bacterium]|nr:hypothetical protein [Burkholderiaceae bacterium]
MGYAPASATAAQKAAITATNSTTLAAVSVGAAGNTRQITNVAAGTANSDAVNVAQLIAAQTHYYSVNDNGTVGANYNNDGATGVNALAAGVNASASNTYGIAVGYTASASGSAATAIGDTAKAQGTGSIALGYNANAANFADNLAIGTNASASNATASAIGVMSQATGVDSISFGSFSQASNTSAIAIGMLANASLADSVALGSRSTTATGATKEVSATLNGLTYGTFAGQVGNPGMEVSVGSAGAERQIKNVGSGAISATSTDAI